MFGLGPTELILIFLAILLLFGAKRLPEMARGLGKGIKEFKRAMKETSDEIKGSLDEGDQATGKPTNDNAKDQNQERKPG